MKFVPYEYQQRAIDRILDCPAVGLLLEMGLGKTVISLTAAQVLLYDRFEVSRVLVIAPLKVAEDTWSRESEKWDHLKGLRIAKVLGPEPQRLRALDEEADIYVVNRENVVWLVDHYKRRWPFDMVIIDELSSFKNPQARRFRALRKVMPLVRRVVGLTGTPSPNSLMDLWAEVYLLDRGRRLGRTLGAYRDAYFKPGARNGYVVYKWNPLPGSEQAIEERISDICISMKASDYLQLPERIDNEIHVSLGEKETRMYKTMEKEQMLQLDGHKEVAALNAAAVMNKLLQMASGQVYDEEGGSVRIHTKKLEALQEIAEDTDSPLLVFYSFRHDSDAIWEVFPQARTLDSPQDITDWNAGRIRLLIAHPASVGYGLNLQEGGHTIIWYSLPWSLELYQQANARLYRQGQTKPVIIHHLIASGTVDENVMRSLKEKDTSQAALMEALKERR